MTQFMNMDEMHIKEALLLALDEYHWECQVCCQLPDRNYEMELKELIIGLCRNPYKKVAIENGKVIGYLAFEGPWDGFFGNVKGVFSPLGGSAFSGTDRNMLASRLFEEVGNDLIADGISSVALSRYAHDDEVGQSFIMNGFGIRCSDAVMCLVDRTPICELNKDIQILELKGEVKRGINHLRAGLIKHLCGAPSFYPSDLSNFYQWCDKDDIRVFAIKEQEHYVGYMAFTAEGENFITGYDKMANICGAFFDDNKRHSGMAQQLLEYICRLLTEEGVEYLGVDCETLNPTAFRFWSKYFANYTYSYARRIDERVIGYDKYMNHMNII